MGFVVLNQISFVGRTGLPDTHGGVDIPKWTGDARHGLRTCPHSGKTKCNLIERGT